MRDLRMVPGSYVLCKRCGSIAVLQSVNLTRGNGVARLVGSAELISLEGSAMRLATPEEVRITH